MATYFAGIDVGSTMTKAVILNRGVIASVIGPTGPEQRRLANKVMEEALKKAALSFEAITAVVSTGYGRINVPFADAQYTEITCHARGIASLFPQARTIIEVGGQDTKAIKIEATGKVTDFVMNDKCAAGSGRFIEVIADALGVPLDDVGESVPAEHATREDQQHLHHLGPAGSGSEPGAGDADPRSSRRGPSVPGRADCHDGPSASGGGSCRRDGRRGQEQGSAESPFRTTRP